MANSNRFLSLDILRGITVCLMILVNSPGTGAETYSYLIHAQWFGFTLADVVFPTFLFVMGNAMSFSMSRLKQEGQQQFWKKIVKRSLIIFLLGYLMYWFPFFTTDLDGDILLKPLSETRIMGVLQRIAICYFIASILLYYFSLRTVLLIAITILFAYWGILFVFGTAGAELEMATNAVTKLDLQILGHGHIYKKDSIPFDPEGILSTLPAIVNVIGGYWAGRFLQKKGKSFETVAKLLVIGYVLIVLALWWNLIFPIGKKLWTSPFVFLTVGIDLCFLAILCYLIEIRKEKRGIYFFSVFGKNPLFIYLFSELFFISLRLIPTASGQDIFEWVSEHVFQNIFPGSLGSFLTSLVFMLLCWLVGYVLDKKRIYIKL